jgi:hypothetical protein
MTQSDRARAIRLAIRETVADNPSLRPCSPGALDALVARYVASSIVVTNEAGDVTGVGGLSLADELELLRDSPSTAALFEAQREARTTPAKDSARKYPGDRTLGEVQQIRDPVLRLQILAEGDGPPPPKNARVVTPAHAGLDPAAVAKMTPLEKMSVANDATFAEDERRKAEKLRGRK